MNPEDAYYYEILLMNGLSDGYDEWLDAYLVQEDPLSEIVLNLALCGSDVDKTISVLHGYCMDGKLDEAVVCEKLRTFLKEAYHSGRFSKEETASYMYRFASTHGDPGDFDMDLWGDMFYMDEYCSMAQDGIIPWERVDFAFLSYLDDGVPIDHDLIWNRTRQTSTSILSKIRDRFSK